MEKFHIDEGKYKTKYYYNIYGIKDIDIEENTLNEDCRFVKHLLQRA